MYESITVQGIVLDTSLLKEYDKRLVILSAELGRITVFANGARKKNSQLTAVSQKFVMGSFTLRPSRSAYTLVSADVKEMFTELSYDLEKMAYASYACELAGYFTQDGVGAKDELNLLYVTFRAILKEKVSLNLIKSVYICKLLDIEGLGLDLTRCVVCGVESNLHHISLEEGGLVCDAVLNKAKSPVYITDDAIYALRYVLSRDIAAVYSFDISIDTCREIEELMETYLKIHAPRHFKSLDILSTLL